MSCVLYLVLCCAKTMWNNTVHIKGKNKLIFEAFRSTHVTIGSVLRLDCRTQCLVHRTGFEVCEGFPHMQCLPHEAPLQTAPRRTPEWPYRDHSTLQSLWILIKLAHLRRGVDCFRARRGFFVRHWGLKKWINLCPENSLYLEKGGSLCCFHYQLQYYLKRL